VLDSDACYDALRARDARFDGVFFVGVSTTGIYCRPVCPARTPGRDRCAFYPSPARAERDGFRACFRCRPELAPGNAIVDAPPRALARALALIADGYLNDHDVDALARELGMTARHLRRTMESAIGVTPIELAQTRRLALAKQLLHDSALGAAEIAFASGFSSVRRFNAAFKQRFGVAPSEMRRAHGSGGDTISLRLDYRAPYAWDDMLAFFRGRAIAGVEAVGDREYRRALAIDGHEGVVRVEHAPDRDALVARVDASLAPALAKLVGKLRRVFDLDARPDVIASALSRDPLLLPLVRARRGLRVPGSFDVFETAARAVLGQQVSVAAARTLAGRLAAKFGTALDAGELTRTFPNASALASASIDDVAKIGLPGKRAASLIAIARAFEAGELSDPSTFRERMIAIDGIGEWTASYVAMRALSDPDAFVASDLGVRKALGLVSAKEAEAMSERWRPWRAYAVQHLWASL
jgi:AraC family transcriptional regulator of adaptative response / DNA-3-methyladenine glycosylase II